MTYSLQISDGDLVASGSEMALVWGQQKLVQDLWLWLTERYGIDRFHPRMGSTLPNYIGSAIGPNTNSTIQQEAMRVLQNYQRVQALSFKAAPQAFSMDELLYSINSITVGSSYDSVAVSVSISNGAAQSSTVNVTQGVS